MAFSMRFFTAASAKKLCNTTYNIHKESNSQCSEFNEIIFYKLDNIKPAEVKNLSRPMSLS